MHPQLLSRGESLRPVGAVLLVAGRPHRHRRQAVPQEGRRDSAIQGKILFSAVAKFLSVMHCL